MWGSRWCRPSSSQRAAKNGCAAVIRGFIARTLPTFARTPATSSRSAIRAAAQWDRLLPGIVSTLTELLHPRGIIARNDPRARVLEGLEQRVDVLSGDIPDAVPVTESGIEYDVDLRRGQKTGLFLDQRENRAAAAAYARGRLLDGFSYHGGFALVMGRRSQETRAFDVSEDAIARL